MYTRLDMDYGPFESVLSPLYYSVVTIEALRIAATEVGMPEDPAVEYPVVRLVSPLSSLGDRHEVVGEVADRIEAMFDLTRDGASSRMRDPTLQL